MKKLYIALACIGIIFNIFNTANAQDVTLLENDGKMAIFSVNATAAKSGDVAPTAIATLFRTLIDEGVEGVFDGQKMMQIDNQKWRNTFLAQKNPQYMTYVKGYQTEGEPLKNNVGEYQATVLVRVNVEFLIRQLKAYGVMNK